MRIMTDKMIFCTLFDSNYLDKGLALYWSMIRNITDFKLYIFAFDDKCFEILEHIHLKNTVVLSVHDIMTESLCKIQKERTRAEFCWTCTPLIMEYVLINRGENICTYIDADIYFFSSPKKLIREMIESGSSVGLVEHRFERNYEYGENVFHVGRYCIQFNTFLNNKKGRMVLKDWKESCISWCYSRYEDGKFGDQKYPDKWKQKYTGIYVYQNAGLGVAPWNLHLYSRIKKKDDNISIRYGEQSAVLVFYHFEGMKYLDNGSIYLNLWKPFAFGTKKKVKILYEKYLYEIDVLQKYLKKQYGITFEHTYVDKKLYSGKNYSLLHFCECNGLMDGCIEWSGHWINNIRNVQ
jgi:hypothetical protein